MQCKSLRSVLWQRWEPNAQHVPRKCGHLQTGLCSAHASAHMPAEHGKPGLTQGHALLQAADDLALLEQQVQKRGAAVEAKQRAARLRVEAKAAKARAAKKPALEAELAALALQEQDLDVDLQSNTSLSATLSAAPSTPSAPDTVRITSSVVPC